MVKARQVEGGICYKLDRLARNPVERLGMAKLMDKTGVALHSISEKLDTQSALGRFFFTLTASLAEMERGLISERTKAALALKKNNRQRVRRFAPYGYKFEGDNLITDDTEQEVIGKVIELKAQGQSIRCIVAFLKEHGYRNRHNRPIGRSETWTILKKAA
jgi:site-specific DNA recombinase